MIRQYVGARYVPKYSDINDGIWDNRYSYEALEIVKYGNDFYTSKKPVPVGIDITNTVYWIQTGNEGGAIRSLQERMSAAEADIDELTTLEMLQDELSLFAVGSSTDNISGDATLIIFPNDKTMLVDTLDHASINKVKSLLINNGIHHLDYIVISHYHGDHDEGLLNNDLDDYIDNNTIVYLADVTDTGWAADYGSRQAAIAAACAELGATVVYPSDYDIVVIDNQRDIDIMFRNCKSMTQQYISTGDYNNASMVAVIRYAQSRILMSGDIAYAAQQFLSGSIGKVTLYKAHHHGSDKFQYAAWMSEVAPDSIYACIGDTFYQSAFMSRNFVELCASYGYNLCETVSNPVVSYKINGYGIVENNNKCVNKFNVIRSLSEIYGTDTTSDTLAQFVAKIPYFTTLELMIDAVKAPNIASDLGLTGGGITLYATKYHNDYFSIHIYDITAHKRFNIDVINNIPSLKTTGNELNFRGNMTTTGNNVSCNFLTDTLNTGYIHNGADIILDAGSYVFEILFNIVVPANTSPALAKYNIMGRDYSICVFNPTGTDAIISASLNDVISLNAGTYHIYNGSGYSTQVNGSLRRIPTLSE